MSTDPLQHAADNVATIYAAAMADVLNTLDTTKNRVRDELLDVRRCNCLLKARIDFLERANGEWRILAMRSLLGDLTVEQIKARAFHDMLSNNVRPMEEIQKELSQLVARVEAFTARDPSDNRRPRRIAIEGE